MKNSTTRMSDDTKAQLDRNSQDIRNWKIRIPILWGLGILITLGSTLWGGAVYYTNKVNDEAAFRIGQKNQTTEMKQYIDESLQKQSTKESNDINTLSITLTGVINTNQSQTADAIKLLREECKRMMMESRESRTLHYHYDENGQRDVTSSQNK